MNAVIRHRDPIDVLFAGLIALRDRLAELLDKVVHHAVTHTTTVRTGICNYVLPLLDAGSPPGHIELQTSGNVVVATLTLSNTSFSVSGGVGTAAAITSDTNAAGGTAAKAVFKNAAGTEIFECSVTATGGGGDITFNSVVISAGQTVAITSLTYTPA